MTSYTLPEIVTQMSSRLLWDCRSSIVKVLTSDMMI